MLLRRMVDNIANSDDVAALKRYPTLKREIVTAAYRALERFKEETRRMVGGLSGVVGSGRCSCRPAAPARLLYQGWLLLCQAVPLPTIGPTNPLSLDPPSINHPPEQVNIMVEMERNYITAEYFRTIQVGLMGRC